MDGQQGKAAALFGQQVAALRAQGVQLGLPALPAGLPWLALGQFVQRPAGQLLHQRRRAEQHQPDDDPGHHGIGGGQVVQHACGVGGQPAAVPQQQYGGVKQHRRFVEDVLQGHEPDAGAERQPAQVQVVGLHGHGPGPQTDDVAESAHPCVVYAVPQRKARQAAADDEPAGHALQQRVGDAQSQHRCDLPGRKLCQCGGDLGPVVPEQQHQDPREHQQDADGGEGFFAGRRRTVGGGVAHRGGSFREKFG